MPQPAGVRPTSKAAAHTRAPAAPQPTGWRRSVSALGIRDYRFHWFGHLLVMGALSMELIARGYLVYELTGSGRLLGLVSAGAALPMLFLGPIGGAVSDRLERRRVIQISQALVAGTSLFVALSITTNTITWVHLLASALAHGVSMSFLLPARQSIIPKMVGPERMSNAMALNAAGFSFTSLLGPAAAGFLYAEIDPDGVFYISFGMTVAAFISTTQIRPAPGGAPAAMSRLVAEVIDGLRYVARRRLLQASLALMLATTLFVHTTIFLLPVIVVDVYKRTADAYGVLISMEGLGSLIGALAFASVALRRSGMVLIVSCMASGVVLLLISLVSDYYVVVAFMVGLGVAETGRRVLSQSILLSESEDAYRGRTMSLYAMVVGLMPLGVLPAGAAMDWLGGQATLFILGALMVGSCGLVLVTQRELRDLA